MKNYSLLILLLVVACSRNPIGFEDEKLEGEPPVGLGLVPFYVEAPAAGFTQNPNLPDTPIDILFSIDNSPSMDPFIENLQKNSGTFAQRLTGHGINYQLGAVKSTETSAQMNYDPKLVGTPGVVKSTDADPVSKFVNNIQAIRNSYRGSEERPVFILEEAIKDAANQALFRPNSYKVFFVLTDTEDVQYLSDPKGAIGKVRNVFDSFSRPIPWTLVGIGSPTGAPCHFAEMPEQILLNGLAAISGGYLGRICDPDYSSIMEKAVESIVAATTEYTLPGPAIPFPGERVDSDSVIVLVNKNPIPNDPVNGFTVNTTRGSILFHGDAVPRPGEKVEVTYDFFVP